MDRLREKVAMVFGAGPNIGGTIAHFFAREGASVVVCDRSEQAIDETVQFLSERGYQASGVLVDATKEEDVQNAVSKTIERHGRLDVIVNTSGKIHWCPIVDMKLEEWTEGLTSFPTAGMLTTKHAARAMIAGKRPGSIIHILSTAAHFGEASGAAYTSAKAALLSLARSAAMDLAHKGIRVNTITPCGMEHGLWTEHRRELFDPEFERPNRFSYYSRDDYLKMIPLQRFPRAADLAWAAVYLASDEASFLTGVDIPVDGGLRFKYPTWRPGEHWDLNVKDYAKRIRITRYGEETDDLFAKEAEE